MKQSCFVVKTDWAFLFLEFLQISKRIERLGCCTGTKESEYLLSARLYYCVNAFILHDVLDRPFLCWEMSSCRLRTLLMWMTPDAVILLHYFRLILVASSRLVPPRKTSGLRMTRKEGLLTSIKSSIGSLRLLCQWLLDIPQYSILCHVE